MKYNQSSTPWWCLAVGVAATGSFSLALAEEAADPTAWKTSAALGATLARGNTENFLLSASVLSEKKWNKNEFSIGASAGYGETTDTIEVTNPDGTTSTREVDNTTTAFASGFAQYNRLLTERLYGYLRADALHDSIADIDYRVTLSPGVGYYLVKNEKFTLSGEVGPGVVFEKLAGQTDDYFTIRFGEKFTWQINERARLWQSLDYNPQVDDFGNYVINAEAGIETDITKHLALRVVAQDSYRSEPAPGRKENDFKLIAGIAYKF